jgi:hypothetical protein
MTDAQFGALLTAVIAGLGGIAGMIRWAVTRITKAWDDQSSSNLRLADAQLELAGSMAAMRADIDHVMRWMYMHTPSPPHVPIPTPVGLQPLEPEEFDDPQQRPGSSRRRSAGQARIGSGGNTAARGVPVSDYPRRESGPTPNYRGGRPDTRDDDDSRDR